jgi:hypothetical protein
MTPVTHNGGTEKLLREMKDILAGMSKILEEDWKLAAEDRKLAAEDRKQAAEDRKLAAEDRREAAEDRKRAAKRDEQFARIFISTGKVFDQILTHQNEHTLLLKEIISILKRGGNGRLGGSNGPRRK